MVRPSVVLHVLLIKIQQRGEGAGRSARGPMGGEEAGRSARGPMGSRHYYTTMVQNVAHRLSPETRCIMLEHDF